MATVADEWEQVASDPGFQALPSNHQDAVRMAFFDKKIAPSVPGEHVDAARSSFFRDSQPKPAANPSADILDTLASAATGGVPLPKGAGSAALEQLNHPVAQQIMQGMTKGATMGMKGVDGVPEPATLPLKAARLGGEILGGAPAASLFGAVAAPLAPAAELAGKALPEATPAVLRAMLPKALMGATEGAAYGGARVEGETRGEATLPQVAGGVAAGGAAGGVLGGAFGAIKARFPDLFAAADEARAPQPTPQPSEPIEPPPPPPGASPAAAAPEPAPGLPSTPQAEIPAALPKPNEPASPVVQPPKPDDMVPGFNLTKVAEPAPTRDQIGDMALDNPAAIDSARRGVMSFPQQLAGAAKDSSTIDDMIQRWKPGQALNTEQLILAKQMTISKSQEVVDLARRIAGGEDTPQLRTQLELAKAQQLAIQRVASGGRAEAARATGAGRMMLNALQSGDQRLMARVLQKLGPNKMPEGVIDGLAALPKDDPAAAVKFLQNMDKPGFMEHVQSYFVNSILSGPTSIGKVGMAGMINNALRTATTGLKGAIDLPVSWLQDRPRAFFASDALPMMRGGLEGIPTGFSKALYMLKNGISSDQLTGLETWNREVGPAALNMPTRAHRAMYEISGTIAHQAELHASAAREATQEALAKGMTGASRASYIEQRSANLLAHPSKTMLEAAEGAKKEVTFTAEHEPGTIFAGLRNFINSKVETPLGTVQPLKFLQPFVNIPGNIIKQGIAYSPVGLANAARTAATEGGPKVSEELAKGIIGTAGLMGMGGLMANGKVWGSAPSDPAARDAFFRQNKIEYGMRIGDKIVAWDKIEPLSTMIKPVINVLTAAKNGDIPDEKRHVEVAKALGAGLLDTSQTSGLFEAAKAIQDPGRYGSSYLNRFAQAAVPYSGAMRSVAQTMDPTVRAPHSVGDSIKSIIPGKSQEVPAKTDLLGRPVVREGGTLQPIRYATATPDPVNDFIKAHGIKLTEPGSHLGLRTLDPDTKTAYIAERGQAIQKAIERAKRVGGDGPLSGAWAKAQIQHAEAQVRTRYEGIAELKALGIPGTGDPARDNATIARAAIVSKNPFYKRMTDDQRRELLGGSR